MKFSISLMALASLPATRGFTASIPPTSRSRLSSSSSTTFLRDTIVSPFDNTSDDNEGDPVATLPDMSEKGPLDLTWDNVELVLDDMRSYLIQDGGNVVISEIDGPVVRLELQGACGTCPSSTVSGGVYMVEFFLLRLWGFLIFFISRNFLMEK